VVDFNELHNATHHSRVTVRAAALADAPAIAAVHVAGWEGAYRGMVPDEEIDRRTVAWRTEMWEGILQATVDGNRPWVAVAQRDGATIGFASMSLRPPTAEITAIYVDPAVWRSGAGTALMDAALARATASGCADVTLWVLEPNLRARAFYERCEFAHDGGRQNEGDGWRDELRMRRTL
jgi:ribosomal protein S18 acetylase RimI-like enzyme